MSYRRLAELGLHPIAVISLIIVAFIGISIFLFSRTDWAEYGYVLIGLSLVSQSSESRRNDFLKQCFSSREYRKLRLLENALLAFPFLAFLIYKQMFLSAIIMLLLSLLLAIININRSFGLTLPTLFSKNPFEFTVGFRNNFYLFIIAYILTAISVSVGNFNLGLASLVLIFLVSFSFYSKPEHEYYVWMFDLSPKRFLMEKIKVGLWHATILCIPILMTLAFFFFTKVYFVLIVLFLGYIYLSTMILAKYSAYPNEMNVPQGFLLAISFFLPPLLLVVIPFFYSQSVKRLNNLLI